MEGDGEAADEAAVGVPPVPRSGGSRRRVLVTGGSGLLGRPLCQELVRRGFAVTSVSSRRFEKLHERTQQLFTEKQVPHIEIDLETDVTASRAVGLACLVEEECFDLIVNLAADRGGVTWDGRQKRMNNVILNTDLPACLGEIASRQNVRVFQISTEYVWTGQGNTDDGYPPSEIGEDPRFVQESGPPYALQKKEAEEMVKGNRLVTTLRVPVLFGPMFSELEDGTAGSSIFNFLGDNDWKHDSWQRRYPTCTIDVAFIIGALVNKLFRCGLERSVYNYGAQGSVSKYQFLEIFQRASGISDDIRTIVEEDASTRPPGKQPPFDVKLGIGETRRELGDDWREPRDLSVADMKEVWLQVPIFADAVRELRAFAEPEEPEEEAGDPGAGDDGRKSTASRVTTSFSHSLSIASKEQSFSHSLSGVGAPRPTPGY